MIVVDGVGHDFGRQPVLEDVHFEVAPHELLCVVGPSGCGKTTLLRIIAGLLAPTAGDVRIDGEPVRGPSARSAMVFQHFGLFPWKTVRANIAYGLANRGRRERRAGGVADADHGPGRRRRPLSAPALRRHAPARRPGQGARGGARGAVHGEPFGSLDAITREQLPGRAAGIWERDAGVTGVFITHDIDEAILPGRPDRRAAGDRAAPRGRSRFPIPRPRTVQGVRAHPAYPELRAGDMALAAADQPGAAVG